ncbi:sensor histidine kinase [Rhizobium sp. SL42]|uniref:sensor histidine kinase n=1 Tax=Rhizobium sp. SL42 TaxID=2806346 RepID=UPI001F34CE3C|nr:HAMP domain-containing sensor histidine kinase [Rhizobium sp. SL42]UJW74426.1 HAMP domain-containing histidine kinase [Rhizobium sp. SL42]
MMQSIRGRFILVSLISVLVALAMASLVMVLLFTRNLEARVDTELSGHINNIAGALRFAGDGALDLPDRPVDRRFEEPYGGLYWQVEDDDRASELRSASLWDFTLPLPDDVQETGTIHRYQLPGPEGTDLIVQERKIIFAAPGGKRAIRIAAAINASVVSDASRAFAFDIIPYMLALAAFLIAASLAQLTFGLKPISSVANGLDRIRERRAERLDGRYPKEFKDVVSAVNQLLDAQAQLIEKAKSRAADLAHGLKTPLTVLSNDAATLRERGEVAIADELTHLAGVMQAHVEHELTMSRIAANASLRRSDANIAAAVDLIVKTLRRTPRGERLNWHIAVPPDLAVGVDPHDLQELLGNILDNSVKWSKTEISIEANRHEQRTQLIIEDDGPGADPAGLRTMMERGTRLDLKTPGTGIGLAIVRDIAAVYDLSVEIDNRPHGGLRIRILL